MYKIGRILFIFIVIGFFIYQYLFYSSLYEKFDKKFIDLFFQIRGEKPVSPDVVIVDIDERSLANLGQWPWPRWKVAKILDNLTKTGAGIIGLDIVFAEPDNSSPARVLQKLHIKNVRAPDYDAILAHSIANSPTILGYIFYFHQKKGGTPPNIPAIFIERNPPQNGHFLLEASGVVLNIPIIQQAAYSSGFFNTIPDGDGVVRSAPLLMRYQNGMYPSLAMEIVRVAIGVKKVFINYSDVGVDTITLGELAIPVDRFGRLFINYRGPAKSYRYISAMDIFNNTFDKNLVRGKVVLIGTSALGLLDLRATPFDSTFPGVEIHANIIDNIINQDFLYTPDWIEAFDLTMIVLTGLLMAASLILFSGEWLLVSSLSVFTLFFVGVYTLFSRYGMIVNIIFPFLTMLVLFITLILLNYFFERRQKELIKKKFEKKVSPAVVQDLLKHSDNALEIKEKEVTVFFSDIRSFTTISEKIGDPKRLIQLLNSYMTPMVDIIFRYRGTIDKFIGDAIMAYWNAPNDVANHYDMAVQSAIEQIAYLHSTLNPSFVQRGFPIINIGIGINSGDVIVGEMGSEGRSDYTVIGDNVNLASRLEGLNKYYGTHIIISEFTYKKLQKSYNIRELDIVLVKGKRKAVTIYEVQLQKDTLLEEYYKALHLYREQQFAKAKKMFEELYKKRTDKVFLIYKNRCEEYLTTHKEFRIAYEFTTK